MNPLKLVITEVENGYVITRPLDSSYESPRWVASSIKDLKDLVEKLAAVALDERLPKAKDPAF